MRAIRVVDLIGPEGVSLEDVPAPRRGTGNVTVDVKAVGLAFPDLLRSRGHYQTSVAPPFTLGGEFAGIVRHAPSGTGFHPGDRVGGTTDGTGAGVERLVVGPHSLVALPASMSFEQGAGLLFNYETAIFALEMRAQLTAGEVLLVHGAGGGTGTAAIQIGKAMGAFVVGVASSAAKRRAASSAGADAVVTLGDDWKDKVMESTAGRAADVIFDPVGGSLMLDSIRCLGAGGRWLIVGFAAGAIQEIPANRLLLKNAAAVGCYVGGYLEEGRVAQAKLRDRLLGFLDRQAIQPIVGATFPPERAAEALAYLADRRIAGKVVISFDPQSAASATCH
jgi:NADPH2:quinone reductase